MEPTVSFGYWLRRQRKALDLTQQALAELVGCSLAAIKKIEQDERRPSRQIAELLANVLGVAASQREIFLEVARGIRPVDQLALAHEPATSPLPTGIVTFLFTDIEDSTKLAQEHPKEWERLRARHHAILRETMAAHHGYVFQVIGDAFCAAFDTPNDALLAALDSQRKLQTENWGEAALTVRMGIHTGEAVVHGNEYHGYLTLSLVQRIMSAGHGGQMLLSDATENLLRGHLPKDISLLDLGQHKFKDIQQPIRVFQVIAPDLHREFSGLRAWDFSPNNLPLQLTSFIGREKESADIIRLLEKARLVTLTGPGGTGKTRLAIEVAKQLLEQYPDGVWMVELAPILDPILIPRTTAIAIGLRDEPHRPVIEMLCDYLRDRKLLLILDNCEHLIDGCAQLAETILHACPQIHILATSREAIAIAGETLYLVPSLTRPDIRNLPSVESLSQYEAIRLFIDRAAAAVPSFTLTNENASSIVQICQRLDGIPLAIELVVGKVRALSVQQIAQHLDNRFQLLSSGGHATLPRHQTLRAATDWSYNLLSRAEQILFRRLSVFIGGWTLEAAESVCSDHDISAHDALQAEDILELLSQLINKSLVATAERNGEVRYRMLETIRQYASDKLQAANESESLRARHLDYFLQLAKTAEPHLIRPDQWEWLARLDADHDNLRTGLESALNKESSEPLLRLCVALGMFWHIHAYWMEGSTWLEKALSKKGQNPTVAEKSLRVKALYLDAQMAENLDNAERVRASAQLSLTLAQEGTDSQDIAIARIFVGLSMWQNDPGSARELLEKSITELQSLLNSYWLTYAYNLLNLLRISQADVRLSEERPFTQALEYAREAGERSNLAFALYNYARWLHIFHRIHDAQKYANDSQLLLKKISSDTRYSAYLLGELAFFQGNYREAESIFFGIQQKLKLLGEKMWRSGAMEWLGRIAIEQGELSQAQTCFEEALEIAYDMGYKVYISNRLIWLGMILFLQGKTEKCREYLHKGLELAKGLGWHIKTSTLLILVNYVLIQKPSSFVYILGAIDGWHRDHELQIPPLPPLLKRYHDHAMEIARNTLDDPSFQSAFAEGKKMSLDEALELASEIVEEKSR